MLVRCLTNNSKISCLTHLPISVYLSIYFQSPNSLFLDTAREEVVLAVSSDCSTEQLAAKVPEESARYHLFRFKHTHQGDYKESNGEFGNWSV